MRLGYMRGRLRFGRFNPAVLAKVFHLSGTPRGYGVPYVGVIAEVGATPVLPDLCTPASPGMANSRNTATVIRPDPYVHVVLGTGGKPEVGPSVIVPDPVYVVDFHTGGGKRSGLHQPYEPMGFVLLPLEADKPITHRTWKACRAVHLAA